MTKQFYQLEDFVSRTITPENPTGEKGKGAMAEPEKGSAGEHLGKGWKSRPNVLIDEYSEFEMMNIEAEGVIKSIWLTGEVDRGVIIRMYWDDQEVPSVECPITDFFLYGWSGPHHMKDGNWNAGPQYQVDSCFMAVHPNRGFNCFIPMPFKKRARITLENRTKNKKYVYYQVNMEEKKIENNIGYFHAQFRVSMPVQYKDVHTLLDGVKGSGLYIGTALYVGLNRASRWWGEGEFKFYLDGDKEYPTICTTGLEDYFGGAFNWDCEGEYQEYSGLYMGMPHISKPDGLYEVQQRFSLYRWHEKDPIRFNEEIKVTVQDLGWTKDDDGVWKRFLQREDDMMSVSYWYQTLPTNPFPPLISHEDLNERF
ncbi:glycoside hydrolase family 172 protein [Paenibacillus chungangensis]|uniref:Glycoside hydrolase family 172 protein n=1 Tax=Paenibacillus chungangensis TaxID=696535 RepID=A0ABW3HU10_9BACL